ncbi:hypothetical protein TrVFT333_002292 [Trichoderma virens FT-333]|nr:hypothetical protein TrVFT333_002292 [Trichoderma virens FT-333]
MLHALPSQLARRGVACDYPHHRKERVRRGDRDTPDEVSPSTSHQSSRTVATDKSLHKLPSRLGQENAHHQLSELDELDFLAASFLDPDHFILAQLETQKKDVGITKSVADLVGSVSDIQATAQVFFETIHVWMPIVSKKQFQDYLLQRLAFRRAEFFLLVLAMKLCSSRITVAKSMLYRTVKQLYFDIESSGRLSIQTLQAAVLIAIYEIGHGIYPAAIISVANCARIGTIIGIDRSLNTWDFISRGPWIELEERRRVWWAIIILDRFMNLCYPKRYLVTPDPDPESYLPVDDGDWDSGFSKPEDAVTLRLSSQVHIGRFARFAHAVPLFSQALSRAHEDPQNTAQLRLFVLDNASSRSSTQDHARPIEDFISPETISALEHALKVMAQEYFESIAQDCDTLSPFLLHMLYRALMAYLRMKHDPAAGPDIALNIQALKLALERFRTRWLVAGMLE